MYVHFLLLQTCYSEIDQSLLPASLNAVLTVFSYSAGPLPAVAKCLLLPAQTAPNTFFTKLLYKTYISLNMPNTEWSFSVDLACQPPPSFRGLFILKPLMLP